MAFRRIHRLTTGSVAAAGTKEDTWTSDADYTLVCVQVTARGNTLLANVQILADIDGVPIYRPDIPADLLDPANPQQTDVNTPFKKGSAFKYKLTNSGGAAETYDLSLVLESDVWPPKAA